ncbi:hypothetical protein ACFU8W_35560 [Streptomyces sp. NPDC057565]|uniref:hypothetical protein n=1 Tax=Streptomyces sp. NPDC057565 TaxID=3346169 RepID=UPI0036C582F6
MDPGLRWLPVTQVQVPVAMSDGYCESADSWADLLRDCRRRGMRAPVLAVGDRALVRAGARFERGLLVERPKATAA